MLTKTCECGKIIEAYTKNQLDYQMKQHKLSKLHKKFEERKKG